MQATGHFWAIVTPTLRDPPSNCFFGSYRDGVGLLFVTCLFCIYETGNGSIRSLSYQRGSPNLAVNLAINEILVHKVGVDIDTPL